MAEYFMIDEKHLANVKALLELIGHYKLMLQALEDRVAKELREATGVDISVVKAELDIDTGALVAPEKTHWDCCDKDGNIYTWEEDG